MKKLIDTIKQSNDWVIFDTETTGLDNTAEICQIGLLAPDGTVLMDKLVKPSTHIPPSATNVHGITNEMVADAPAITDIENLLRTAMAGKLVVVYNAPFDRRMLIQSFRPAYHPYYHPGEVSNWPHHWFNCLEYLDVMIPYVEFYGDWNDYHGNYRWQKLTNACQQQGIEIRDAHNAIGDCKMTLALLQKFMDGE